MTLRGFVDAAYALMVRTYAGIPGKNLLDAVELANQTFGIQQSTEVEKISTQNDASIQQLNQLLAGVK